MDPNAGRRYRSDQLKAKVWLDTAAEPGAFQLSSGDTTADRQVAGGVGVVDYLATSTTNPAIVTSFDDLSVKKTQP